MPQRIDTGKANQAFVVRHILLEQTQQITAARHETRPIWSAV
jgi:hypothetical protein